MFRRYEAALPASSQVILTRPETALPGSSQFLLTVPQSVSSDTAD
ncbi:hypothetical protein [Tateyamaria sp.]